VPPVLPARILSNHSVSSNQRFGTALVQEVELGFNAVKGIKTLAKTFQFDATKGFNTAVFGSGLKGIGSLNRIQDVQSGRLQGRSVSQQVAQEGLIIGSIGLVTFLIKGALSKLPPIADFMILAGAYQASEKISRRLTGAYDSNKAEKEVSTALRTSSLTGSGGAPVVLEAELDSLPSSSMAPLPSVAGSMPIQTTSLFSSTPVTQEKQISFTPSSSSQLGPSYLSSVPAFSFSPDKVNPFFAPLNVSV
jgi:hypothetical protein